jgi:hypothetical protein
MGQNENGEGGHFQRDIFEVGHLGSSGRRLAARQRLRQVFFRRG